MHISSGKQSWLFKKFSFPHADRDELYKQIFIIWFGWGSAYKNNYICFPPIRQSLSILFPSNSLSSTANSFSAGNFQESCSVVTGPFVASFTIAFKGPTISSHLTLKINREHCGLRGSDWDKQSLMCFRVWGPYLKQLTCWTQPALPGNSIPLEYKVYVAAVLPVKSE